VSAPVVGSKVVHYTIVRSIGAGGMGVVYEAEDAKLGRRVALKFLPPELSRDRPALERFQREARAASALNHPNICTICAIEESGGDCFIAMELLDGESLDRQIVSRIATWDAVADIGIQVADALAAAHRRGIVHRDIKPANIFLTRDGRAKVLDFGIAKVTPTPGSNDETMSVSAAGSRLTGVGLTVGTIGYMSPEQARGDELDARSDLFSLAAVLYEMATRQPAFDGRTTAVVFQQILDGTPESPARVNHALPARLDEIIVKGLEKDRELRYQTAEELRGDLKRLKRDASSGKLVAATSHTQAESPRSSGEILAAEARRRKGLVSVLGMVLVATVAAAAYGIYAIVWRPAPATQSTASSRMRINRLTTSGEIRGCGSISPDGKYVAYCDFSGELIVQQVATGSTVPLGNVDGATTFSADSNFVYVTRSSENSESGVLWAYPTFSGEPRRVASDVAGAVGVSPDGKHVVFLREKRTEQTQTQTVMIADAFGGNERALLSSTMAETWFENAGLSWSPDGKLISTTQATIVGGYRMRPVVIDVETGKLSTISNDTWAGVGRTAWLPGSHSFLFAAQESIVGPFQFWIAQYPGGRATRITNDARGFGNMSVSVTADGSTIATVPFELISNLWRTNADASAPLEQWTSGAQVDGDVGIAPLADGRVFYTSGDGVDQAIWSVDAAGGRPRNLTRQYAEVPSLPADGRFIIFGALQEGRFRIWRMQPDGSEARPITSGQDDINPRISPDGRWVYYMAADASGDRLRRVSADGGPSTALGEEGMQAAGLSPDGRQLLVRKRATTASPEPYAILDAVRCGNFWCCRGWPGPIGDAAMISCRTCSTRTASPTCGSSRSPAGLRASSRDSRTATSSTLRTRLTAPGCSSRVAAGRAIWC